VGVPSVVTGLLWTVSEAVSECGDTSRRKLTPPLIMFVLLRAIAIAIAIAGAVALAFGLNLSHGNWLPIATIVAMKAGLDQTTIAAAQRVAGALIGAAAAALLLATCADDRH
jgi:Fusaric acid resistance protein-like